MASYSDGDEFVVFKFPETGLVALCHEVAQMDRDGELQRFRARRATAAYRLDPDTGNHEIVFKLGGA